MLERLMPSRRWLRISLRSMFFLILCLAGTFAGYRAGHRSGYHDGSQLIRVMYPVADLVLPLEPVAPRAATVGGPAPLQAVSAKSPAPPFAPIGLRSGSADFESLIDLMTVHIQPETWEQNGGKAFMRPVEAHLSLVVLQSGANHARIEELFALLRRNQRLNRLRPARR